MLDKSVVFIILLVIGLFLAFMMLGPSMLESLWELLLETLPPAVLLFGGIGIFFFALIYGAIYSESEKNRTGCRLYLLLFLEMFIFVYFSDRGTPLIMVYLLPVFPNPLLAIMPRTWFCLSTVWMSFFFFGELFN